MRCCEFLPWFFLVIGFVGGGCCCGMGGLVCMIELTFTDDLLGRRLILPRGYLYVSISPEPIGNGGQLTKYRQPKKTRRN